MRLTRFLFLSVVFAFTMAAGAAQVLAQTATAPQVYQCKPGPWGTVEWHYIYLETPDWIVAEFPKPSTQPTWSFPDSSPEKVRAVFNNAGIAQGKVDDWFADKRAILKGPESITLFPKVDDVERLSPSAREIVYAELAKSPRNEFHAEPFFILDRSIDEWLGIRKVRPEIRDVFERLIYKRGDVLAFSDFPVLMSYAKDAAESDDLMKLCTRIRAIMAYLRAETTTDLVAIEKYWSAGFRRKDVLPMLESVSQLPGGGRLGFAHLLPAQPRKLLYTYPTFDLATAGKLPDCHWTTLNFFNYRTENTFLDTRLATSRVLQGYKKVEPPYAFGDALFFLGKDGDALHSCTYLCDDLVYTKNGGAMNAPWVISRIGTVQRLYGPSGVTSVQGYRRVWEAGR
ncbi:MAG: hypothetical protein ABMA01_04280 [Chthoniobacteraceae bacterium]